MEVLICDSFFYFFENIFCVLVSLKLRQVSYSCKRKENRRPAGYMGSAG